MPGKPQLVCGGTRSTAKYIDPSASAACRGGERTSEPVIDTSLVEVKVSLSIRYALMQTDLTLKEAAGADSRGKD